MSEFQEDFTLPSAYRLLRMLPDDVVQQSRKLVYVSVANTIRAVHQPGSVNSSDFGIACTFALPVDDGFDSLLTSIQGVPKTAYGENNPLAHTIDALKLERQTRISRMVSGFHQTKQRLGEGAVLVAVHAVFGLRKPLDVGWGNLGALALIHNADGTGGAAMVSHNGELLHAQYAKPGSTLEIQGQEIDLIADLGSLYDTLTMSEDEIDLLG